VWLKRKKSFERSDSEVKSLKHFEVNKIGFIESEFEESKISERSSKT